MLPLIIFGILIITGWYISHYQVKSDYNDFEVVEIKSLNRKDLHMYSQFSIFYKVTICGLIIYKERFRNELDLYLFPTKEAALKEYDSLIIKQNEYIYST